MTQNPCRYCTDRDPYCHCTCQKYKDWKVLHEAEKMALRCQRTRSYTYARKHRNWARISGNPYERNSRYKYF